MFSFSLLSVYDEILFFSRIVYRALNFFDYFSFFARCRIFFTIKLHSSTHFSFLSSLIDEHSVFLNRCSSFTYNSFSFNLINYHFYHLRSHLEKCESKFLTQYFNTSFRLCETKCRSVCYLYML